MLLKLAAVLFALVLALIGWCLWQAWRALRTGGWYEP